MVSVAGRRAAGPRGPGAEGAINTLTRARFYRACPVVFKEAATSVATHASLARHTPRAEGLSLTTRLRARGPFCPQGPQAVHSQAPAGLAALCHFLTCKGLAKLAAVFRRNLLSRELSREPFVANFGF